MKVKIDVLVTLAGFRGDIEFISKLVTEVEKSKKNLESKGISVKSLYREGEFAFVDYIAVPLIVTFATTVAAEVFANWLYDKMQDRKTKGKGDRIRIGRVYIEMDKEEIRKILIEILERG